MPTLLIPFLDERVRRNFAADSRTWLRERDIRLVLADEDLDDADRGLFDDLLPLPSYHRLEEGVRVLEEYAARHRIDGILAQSEYGLLPAALLRRRIGCPGLTPEAAFACTSKWRSRRLLAAAGVPVPDFALVAEAAQARRFAECAGFPIVLKGVASTMARNVVKVDAATDLAAAVERVRAGIARSPDIERCAEFARLAGLDLECDPHREFLVEACAPGAPAEVDGLVVGREPRAFGALEQVLTPPPLFYLLGYLFPADPAFADGAEIVRVANTAVVASGLTDGGFAVELRVDGRTGIRVIEVNGRLGEDDGFFTMFRSACGVDPLRASVALAAGLGEERATAPVQPCALAYACRFTGGVVTRVPDDAQLEAARAGCLDVRATVAAGTRLHAPPHPDVFPHLAYALATDSRGSRAAYAAARAAVDGLRFSCADDKSLGPLPRQG